MKKIRFKQICLTMLIHCVVFLLLFPALAIAKGSEQTKDPSNNSGHHGNTVQSIGKKKMETKKKHEDQASKKTDKSHGKSDKKPQKKSNKQSQNSNKHQGNKNHQSSNENKAPTPTEQKQNNKTTKGDESKSSTNSTGKKSTQIHLHLKNCSKSVTNVYVQWNNKWVPMTTQGNSPLYKLKDGGEYVKDDITAFKLVTSSNEEVIFPVSELRVGVEAQGTINYWLEDCNEPLKPKEEKPTDPEKENSTECNPNVNSETCSHNDKEKNKNDGVEKEVNTHQATPKDQTGKKDSYNGILPKTGEPNPNYFYLVAGLIVAFVGIYLLKKKK